MNFADARNSAGQRVSPTQGESCDACDAELFVDCCDFSTTSFVRVAGFALDAAAAAAVVENVPLIARLHRTSHCSENRTFSLRGEFCFIHNYSSVKYTDSL